MFCDKNDDVTEKSLWVLGVKPMGIERRAIKLKQCTFSYLFGGQVYLIYLNKCSYNIILNSSLICPYNIDFASFLHLFLSFPLFLRSFRIFSLKILFSLSRPTLPTDMFFDLE